MPQTRTGTPTQQKLIEDVLTWLGGQERRPKRSEVAKHYADLIAEHRGHLGDINVTPLNLAIMGRWSPSGLDWIKRRAWRLAEDAKRREADRRS
jgi:hypothetical protein